MKYFILFISFIILQPGFLWAQQESRFIEGKVVELSPEGTEIPLIGANLYWLNTTTGASSGRSGYFKIERIDDTSKLLVSFVGYQTDTIDVSGKNNIHVHLTASVELDEVQVIHRSKTTEISHLNPIKVEKIGENELLKAACCNLSESFETNPSVDVTFTDAVTGTRQIQMLGLAGPYTQIMRENIPDIRGLSAIYGLTYVPGTWIESIQLNKGTGSVVNGYESVAGQINIELRKPEEADRLYLNAFGNRKGRIEGNANLVHRFRNGKWSTAFLLHGKNNSIRWDKNKDGFLDSPLNKSYIGLNRWKYYGPNGFRVQFGLKGTYIENTGGQIEIRLNERDPSDDIWGMKLNMQRMEGWAKFGYVSSETPWRSMALQLSGAEHRQDSYFGLNRYDADQKTFYTNLLYQDRIINESHKFKTGISFSYDQYNELLNDTAFNRKEVVPGAYLEYTFSHSHKFNAVAGIRADYHNLFGMMITPRIHLRYEISERTILRASGGRAQRTANIISENNGLLASSRQIIIHGENIGNKPYGLDQEVAWNYGINLTQKFRIDYREGYISLDLYRTDFKNQVVVDLEQSPQTAVFYNLEGRSFSNSFQAQIDYEAIKRLDVRIAYRWYDVRTTYHGKLMEKPLIAAHRAFINLAYETRNHWKFDYTLNWQGDKRIPYTESNPEEYRLPDRSPDFILMNAQISKSWNEKFEVYVGAENLLNYTQGNPILASDQPFSEYFDSSMVWGPIFGRNFYVGLRLKIK